MTVKTNKGQFSVRYAYEKQDDKRGKITVLVINDPNNEMPFTGEFGDEIPVLESVRKEYSVEVIA